MIGLAASLIGIGRWLREAAGATFRWVMAHPAQAALIAALFALWWQHGTLNGVRKDLVAMERARDAEKAARLVTIANYREASKRAQAAAEAKKRAIEAEHKRIAAHADENYASLRAQYRALLMRHTAKTDSSAANGDGMPERASTAGVSHESASPAGFYISRSDGLKTADLGAYAVACFKWAEDVARAESE